jgi:hypothetical protein
MKLFGKMFRIFLVCTFLTITTSYHCQGVHIGGNNPPDPSAILELSGQQGFLMPRMNISERNSISGPAVGLQIYNTSINCMEVYFPGGWKPVMCDCNTAPADPLVIQGPQHVCPSDTAKAFSTPAIPEAASYVWIADAQDTIVSGQGTNSITINFGSQSGFRAIQVAALNGCGSSDTLTYVVDISNPSPDFSISPFPVSNTGPSVFSALQAGVSCSWTFQGGTPGSSVSASESVSWLNTGTYQVQLSVSDAEGCNALKDSTITVVTCAPTLYSFTTCGQSGPDGPSQLQCDNQYGAGVVNVQAGIQAWTVPLSGTYTITARGAAGSGPAGGLGAVLSGRFSLTAGETIWILVGQQGSSGNSTAHTHPSHSGGGGSFVARGVSYSSATPLIVAGGGGGSQASTDATRHGRFATGNGSGATGISGNGAGGAGYNGDGATETTSGFNIQGARSFVNGGRGGFVETTQNGSLSHGGFGGGGGANHRSTCRIGTGGGGGYSGGAGAGGCNPAVSTLFGAGGLSFNSGTNTTGQNGANSGHGSVTIQYFCP